MAFEHCPWDAFTPATKGWCEARLCALVAEPANAWSNLAFVFVGLFLFWHAQKLGLWRTPFALFGISSVLIGIGSFLFHATATFWGEVLDLSSMYLFSGLMITFEVNHRRALTTTQSIVLFGAVFVTGLTVLLSFPSIGDAVFIAFTAVWALLIGPQLYRDARYRTRELRWMVLIFLTGYGLWNLDIHRVWCDPDRHWLSGHAIWHVTSAVALLLYYLHTRRVHQHLANTPHAA